MARPFFLTKWLVRTGIAGWLPAVRRRLDGGGAFLRYYSDRLLAAPLEDFDGITACLAPHGPEIIDLAQGAPCFDVLPTLSAKLPVDKRGWPPFAGMPELRAAVADKLFMENHLAFDPLGEVLITSGALGAMQTVLDAFINVGDRVVLFDPTAPLYPFLLRGRRARIRWLDAVTDDGRLRFRLDQLATALRGARLIVINSPANPTGGAIAAEDLEQIAWWADRRDALILSDEVLGCFQDEGEPVSVGTLPRAQRRTLTVGSVSKSHALAAARIGWVAGHRNLLRPCHVAAALREPFVSTIGQQMALSALRASHEVFRPILAGIDSRRRYAFDRLRGLELNVPCPAGGFFLWLPVWHLGMRGREFAAKLLDEQKVNVTPGDLFGPSGIGHIRLSVAADDGRLQEGLNRLAAFVQGFRAVPVAELSRAA